MARMQECADFAAPPRLTASRARPNALPGAMVKLRFAPSPTGYLHVGNARAAVVNWLFARNHGGILLLRSDDTDTERGRAEYAEAILADLAWLGLDWDETAKQSDRLDRYAEAAEVLKRAGLLYPCFESEEELAAKRAMQIKRRQPPVYDRAMLNLTPAQRAAAFATGKKPYWRFRLSAGRVGWHDLVLGAREIPLASLSDPVLIRADGTPLYTFTSVVDDIDHAITHVVRGEDHVTNTAVQIDLFGALLGTLAPGRDLPRFAHLPLIADAEGGKLSKRIGSISLRSLKKDGIEARAIAAYLARLGSGREVEPLPLGELAKSFDLGDFGRSPPRFDPRQLLAANRRVLHGMGFAEVAERLPEGADETFWHAIRGNLDLLGEAKLWWEVTTGTIEPPALSEERDFLRLAAETLPAEPWDETTWKAWTSLLGERSERRGRALFHPLRLALTGEERGPEMAALLPLIGRARAARRLELAAS
jgi:glutamyl-tRNA synthetase